MARRIGFLHTAQMHVATFDALLAEHGADVSALHVVREDLLELAIQDGEVGQALTHAVLEVVATLREAGVGLVLCTCSTLGGCAEAAGGAAYLPVLRVDRPMAERAVSLGRRILIVASLPCTVGPTAALLMQAAWAADRRIEPRLLLVDSAWAKLQAGDRDGYLGEIVERLRQESGDADVAVLAQASMAPVAAACNGVVPIPVLSSPRSGLAAALERLAAY